MVKNTTENHYGEENIQVLEGLEPVRKRPGMYIGSTDEKGLHHLAVEILDNSIDEALAGYCTHAYITINADGSLTIEDNGRGHTLRHSQDGGRVCRRGLPYKAARGRQIRRRRLHNQRRSARRGLVLRQRFERVARRRG